MDDSDAVSIGYRESHGGFGTFEPLGPIDPERRQFLWYFLYLCCDIPNLWFLSKGLFILFRYFRISPKCHGKASHDHKMLIGSEQNG